MSRERIVIPDSTQVNRAIKLSYAQAMLNAIFIASTGGMFLVGFAIELGADNILLGLMTSIPQFFVIFQLLSAGFVEQGFSRKGITAVFSFVMPLCWFLVAAIPFFASVMNTTMRFAVLIGVICLVTLCQQMADNARGSWIGDLVPEELRGRFFGYVMRFAGVVGAVFAIIEGRFLDYVKSYGLFAFTALFFFGAVFGLIAAGLNLPQPDCPLPGDGKKPAYLSLLRDTFRNPTFALLALVHCVIVMGGIAGPFIAAYCLRDVGLSFLGLGILNSVVIAAILLFSPVCGKLVDKFGGRPILILGLLITAPCSIVWLFIPPNSPFWAYILLPWTNFIAGAGTAAWSVAISVMIYKMSKPVGRSVQFAVYTVFVVFIAAPMPILGGWLVTHLSNAGYAIDLRITFYLSSAFIFLAAVIAWFLHEPEAVPARVLVFSYFPNWVAKLRIMWENV